MSTPLGIIPCAGLGTRMSMPYNKSKEMLPDPNEYDKPIIQYSIDLCNKYGIEPLVITRKDKTDLISYLNDNNIKYIIVKDTPEWPNTILAAEEHWHSDNILILPDTRFSPENVLSDIKHSLELERSVVFALHKVEDVSKWGEIKAFTYCEKPMNKEPGWVWGLIGFKKWAGKQLFIDMSVRGVKNNHMDYDNFLFLDSFKDITRGKE